MNVVLIFDIGKTNKKAFLFNEEYAIVHEKTEQFEETVDEDGENCENLSLLENWIKTTFDELQANPKFNIVGVNFSTYGASLVYLDKNKNTVLPLYNYLKQYPEKVKNEFLSLFSDTSEMILETASPNLDSLSAGMQVFRVKKEKQDWKDKIDKVVHLPQYVASLIHKNYFSDYTSIGCHTHLWNFKTNEYHKWVINERIIEKFPPIIPTNHVIKNENEQLIGVGIHDSSAALIPYLKLIKEPFVLISTGTWCVSLNPFNEEKLTVEELENDTLMYMSFSGKPVKSSKIFLGELHERETLKISQIFDVEKDFYKQISLNEKLLNTRNPTETLDYQSTTDKEQAYHILMQFIVNKQIKSTNFVLNAETIKSIYVDGGFSKNSIYMYLLAKYYKNCKVFAAETAQASALGAALVLHEHWQNKELENNLISCNQISF